MDEKGREMILINFVIINYYVINLLYEYNLALTLGKTHHVNLRIVAITSFERPHSSAHFAYITRDGFGYINF